MVQPPGGLFRSSPGLAHASGSGLGAFHDAEGAGLLPGPRAEAEVSLAKNGGFREIVKDRYGIDVRLYE